MRRLRFLNGTLMLVLTGVLLQPANQALAGLQEAGPEDQVEESQELEADAEVQRTSSEAAPELITDAGRVIRMEDALARDQEKLIRLRDELEAHEDLFRRAASIVLVLNEEKLELAAQLEELGDGGDPEERSTLEARMATIDTGIGHLKTLSDLLFTAESTTREQIRGLEAQIEGEQRTVDILRGIAPVEEPMARSPELSAAAPPTTPSAVHIPGVPGVGLPAGEAAPKVMPEETPEKIRSSEHLAALREIEKVENAILEADRALEEFVERKESLQAQIELEERFIETAKKSTEEIANTLEYLRAEADTLNQIIPPDMSITTGGLRRTEGLIATLEAEIAQRTADVESVSRRLAEFDDAERQVNQEVEANREALEDARRSLYWLESPLHPQNLLRWLTDRGPRVLLVAIGTVLLLFLVRVAARPTAKTLLGRGRQSHGGRENRAETVGLSFQSIASLFIVVVGILLVFQEAGVDIKTVLGGAAIVGVAFAFGAQNLMRDYFSGLMILLEDQYGLGDLVTIGTVTGTVETVNMRTTVLRDIEGRVHFIPNGDVKLVTNRTYEWGRAVLEIPVGFKQDVDRAMEVLVEVCREMRADPDWAEFLTDDVGMLGVDRFTDYGVIIKFMQQTRPDKIFPVRREILRRVKNRFDEVGIEIQVPQRIVHQGTSRHPDRRPSG